MSKAEQAQPLAVRRWGRMPSTRSELARDAVEHSMMEPSGHSMIHWVVGYTAGGARRERNGE